MAKQALQHDLTQGPIGAKLLRFFLPIAVGTLFQQLYNTVDAMVVGRFVGKEALAAVGGSASQVITLCVGFFVALTGGASAVVAQLRGGRRTRELSDAVHSALAFSIVVGLGMTALALPLAPAILKGMQTPADTMAQSIVYLRVYFGGTVFVLLFNMGSSILRAVGDSRRPLYYLVVCCVCNIALDLLLVVGLHLGVAGAALATVLSQLLSTVLVFRQLCTTREDYRVELAHLRMHGPEMKRMLRIGVPSGLQESMYNVANLILQIAINSLGTIAVAGWSVANKVDGIYCAMSSAMGVAVMTFAGQNFGAGRMDRVHRSFKVSMKIFLVMTLCMEALVAALSRYGLGIFTEDAVVIECTRQILTMLVPFYIVWTLIEGISGILRGVGDAVAPVTITCVGVCVVRLGWVALAFPRMHTLRGLLLCWPLSWVVTAAAMTIYFKSGRWHRKIEALANLTDD